MWSNIISIDKSYRKEIDYIIDKIEKIKDLSFALEESKDRIWLYLASICESSKRIEEEIIKIIENIILTHLKLRFFNDSIQISSYDFEKVALISSLLYLDRNYEETLVRKAFADTEDFNIDGTYHFRLQELTNGWNDLSTLACRLLSSGDEIFDITAFITSTDEKKNRIIVHKNKIVNLTERNEVEMPEIFENTEFNMLAGIISQRPYEIVIDENDYSPEFYSAIKHLARVTKNYA